MNSNKLIKVSAAVLLVCALLFGCTQKEKEVSAPETAASSERETEERSTTGFAQTKAAQTEATTHKVKVTTTKPNIKEKQSVTATERTTSAETQAETGDALKQAEEIFGSFFIDGDEARSKAKGMADDAEIYCVRLKDGTKTYYMAVDLQTAEALALANPQVLREVCRQLDIRQKKTAGDGWVLMDYNHLVGELELHFVGYLLTGALGGENGALARFYRSCRVADLNIDENRFGPMIDIVGVIYG